jgi:hypothetical protein
MLLIIVIALIVVIVLIIIIYLLIKYKKLSFEDSLFGKDSYGFWRSIIKKLIPPIIKENDNQNILGVLDANREDAKYLLDREGKVVKDKSSNKPDKKDQVGNIESIGGEEGVEGNDKKFNKKDGEGLEKPKDAGNKKLTFKKEQKKSSTKDESKKNTGNEKDNDKDGNVLKGDLGYIKISNLEDLLKKLENEELKSILLLLKERNISVIETTVTTKSFMSLKDIINFLKEEIVNYLKDRYENIKIDLSQLRRKGKDVSNITIKLMSVPLKINLFKSSFLKKDFTNVILILESIESEVEALKKDNSN